MAGKLRVLLRRGPSHHDRHGTGEINQLVDKESFYSPNSQVLTWLFDSLHQDNVRRNIQSQYRLYDDIRSLSLSK